MSNTKKNIACPTCQKTNTWIDNNQYRPFCSERCKLIDLGSWANESYRVPGSKVDLDDNDKEDKS